MAKYGIHSYNDHDIVTINRPAKSNTIETTVAKDYSAMMSIHFAQYMAMNYAEILNKQKGTWYIEQFLFFEQHIWPGWVGRGAMVDYLDELKIQQK